MGCARCGNCCIDRTGDKLIGCSRDEDRWLRYRWSPVFPYPDECRFLLPPNKKCQRLCAIHKSPLRPDACRDFPNIPNAAIPDDCKQGRKVRASRQRSAQVRVAPAPPSSLPDPA